MNNVQLLGVIHKDPKQEYTKTQKSITKFVLKVPRGYKDKKTGHEVCDFIACQAWQGLGDVIAKNVKDGDLLCVQGSITVESFTPYKAEKPVYKTYILVKAIDFCGIPRWKAKQYADDLAAGNISQPTDVPGSSYDEMGEAIGNVPEDVLGLDF